jgi:hypothetical protein
VRRGAVLIWGHDPTKCAFAAVKSLRTNSVRASDRESIEGVQCGIGCSVPFSLERVEVKATATAIRRNHEKKRDNIRGHG